MSRHAETRGGSRLARAFVVLGLSCLLVTGCDFAIGGGVLAAGVVAGILSYDCSEGVGVTVWDRSSTHPVCDATVVAQSGGTRVKFSPCYNAFLDEGEWTIIASKDGYRQAVGTVVIPHEHRCSEPSYHSVELTLVRTDEGTGRYMPPVMPAYAPPVSGAPPPGLAPSSVAPTSPSAAPSGTAAPETAPSSSTAAPPAAAFPPVAPSTR